MLFENLKISLIKGKPVSLRQSKKNSAEIYENYKKFIGLSPSSMSDWINCNGFLFSKSDRVSKAAEEGKKEHLKEYQALFNVLINDAPAETEYSYYWSEKIKDATGSLFIEFPFQTMHNPKFSTLGYPDLMLFSDKGNFICDLKTGRVPVDVQRNYQLGMYYLLSKKELFADKPVFFCIFQNNEPHLWELDLSFIEDVKDEIKKIIKKLDKGVIEYNTGVHCNYCFNKNNCVAFYEERSKILENL